MAEDASNRISYYLALDRSYLDACGQIRCWDNLKAGFEDNLLWIKDFDYAQILSPEVKTIPFKMVYYEKEGKLFQMDHVLPDRRVPSILWTPIQRAFPIELPSFNHNYFGIQEKIALKLIPSETEHPSAAMMISLESLAIYLEQAPAVRLAGIKWIVIDARSALLVGVPLLPISGDVYQIWKDFLIPAGYQFDLHLLAGRLNKKLNPNGKYWVVWDRDSRYFLVNKSDLASLSLASFRATNLLV